MQETNNSALIMSKSEWSSTRPIQNKLKQSCSKDDFIMTKKNGSQDRPKKNIHFWIKELTQKM
jgi:hypothetical protein